MDVPVYDRMQRGKLGWLAFVFFVVEIVVITIARDDLGAIGILAVVLAVTLIVLIIVIASVMRVTVTADAIVVAFGRGWPKKRIDRSDVLAHRPVRNSWILGWGIRWFPGGTMWNVWGLDAVELELRSGRRFRIGTDDPDALVAALDR